MYKDMSPQYILGTQAWAQDKLRLTNPYNPDKQPAFYKRWDDGYMEYIRLTKRKGY